jgi:hypothetical protein
LLNIAFAGASELVREVGMDWMSQDLAARFRRVPRRDWRRFTDGASGDQSDGNLPSAAVD